MGMNEKKKIKTREGVCLLSVDFFLIFFFFFKFERSEEYIARPHIDQSKKRKKKKKPIFRHSCLLCLPGAVFFCAEKVFSAHHVPMLFPTSRGFLFCFTQSVNLIVVWLTEHYIMKEG